MFNPIVDFFKERKIKLTPTNLHFRTVLQSEKDSLFLASTALRWRENSQQRAESRFGRREFEIFSLEIISMTEIGL